MQKGKHYATHREKIFNGNNIILNALKMNALNRQKHDTTFL